MPFWIDRKYEVVRRWSNSEIRQIAPLFEGEIVNVSAWDDRDKQGGHYRDYFSRSTSYSLTNYPGWRGFAGRPGEIELDLARDLAPELEGRFDVVFNHTTLEHVFEVRKAFANLCAMSREVVIVVVPFSQVQHESADWGDYWRFTPTCLRALFAENGLEVVYEAASPHRDSAIYLFFVGCRHPRKYEGLWPSFREIGVAGSWIGSSFLSTCYQFARHRIRKTFGWVQDE
jgi:hypothetical protein